MVSAATDGLEQRAAIFSRLVARNRLVGVLRIAVPTIGVLAFVVLAGEIWIQNIARQYGISGVRIDRGALVVETPQYSGIGADGSKYLLTAREARSPIGDPDIIDMTEPVFDLFRIGAAPAHATSDKGILKTGVEQVEVPGILNVRDDDGMHGTLTKFRGDQKTGMMNAAGPVDLTFSDGTHLLADNMHYDGTSSIWSFEQADLTIPDLPADENASGEAVDAGLSASMETAQ